MQNLIDQFGKLFAKKKTPSQIEPEASSENTLLPLPNIKIVLDFPQGEQEAGRAFGAALKKRLQFLGLPIEPRIHIDHGDSAAYFDQAHSDVLDTLYVAVKIEVSPQKPYLARLKFLPPQAPDLTGPENKKKDQEDITSKIFAIYLNKDILNEEVDAFLLLMFSSSLACIYAYSYAFERAIDGLINAHEIRYQDPKSVIHYNNEELNLYLLARVYAELSYSFVLEHYLEKMIKYNLMLIEKFKTGGLYIYPPHIYHDVANGYFHLYRQRNEEHMFNKSVEYFDLALKSAHDIVGSANGAVIANIFSNKYSLLTDNALRNGDGSGIEALIKSIKNFIKDEDAQLTPRSIYSCNENLIALYRYQYESIIDEALNSEIKCHEANINLLRTYPGLGDKVKALMSYAVARRASASQAQGIKELDRVVSIYDEVFSNLDQKQRPADWVRAKVEKAVLLRTIGVIGQNKFRLSTSIDLLHEARDYVLSLGPEPEALLCHCEIELGNSYINSWFVLGRLEALEEANGYYKSASERAEDNQGSGLWMDAKRGLANALQESGLVHERPSQLEAAMRHFDDMIPYLDQLGVLRARLDILISKFYIGQLTHSRPMLENIYKATSALRDEIPPDQHFEPLRKTVSGFMDDQAKRIGNFAKFF